MNSNHNARASLRTIPFKLIMQILVGGAVFGLATLVVILPSILGASIRDALHVSVETVGDFASVSTLGNLCGFFEVMGRGGSINRRRFLIVRSVAAMALLLLQPFASFGVGDGILIRLIITFIVSWLLPFEAIVRSLLKDHLEVSDKKLQAVLTSIFSVSLFVDRVPFIWVANLVHNPWWGLAAAGISLAALSLLSSWLLPSDLGHREEQRVGMKELLGELRSPGLVWAAMLGGIAGVSYQAVDATSSLILSDHGWISLVAVYGVTSLVGGLAALPYGGFVDRKPRFAMIIPASAMVIGYLILLPSLWFGGSGSVIWLALFGVGAVVILIATNCGQVAWITTDTSTSTAAWVAVRIMGITLGAKLGTWMYSGFGFPGALLVGGVFAVVGLALLLPALPHLSKKS